VLSVETITLSLHFVVRRSRNNMKVTCVSMKSQRHCFMHIEQITTKDDVLDHFLFANGEISIDFAE
jgi:hypothetical protein